jgi:crotonobetainyl-CoA:carnitine CoA-transferase CaiB-like acyl-CoA transferase
VLPLSGIRVLDLSRVVSGPFGTQILADLGAEVIRVEKPPAGLVTPRTGQLTREEAFSWGLNRNKQSICLDLRDPRGRELLTRLADASDVVFDNFRPGVTRRLGVDHPALALRNPGIVTCSLTGFGSNGPLAQMPAYDPTVQAMSGAMNFTRASEEGEPPVRWGIPICDLYAGIFSCIGIAAALLERDHTSRGDHVDIAMLDVALALNTYRVPLALTFGQEPKPTPNEGGQGTVPYGTFQCGDGWISIGVNQRMWPNACQVLGRPDLVANPRFRDNAARYANRRELAEIFAAELRRRPAQQWQDDLLTAGVIAGKVNTIAEAMSHPQVRAREMSVHLRDDAGRRATVAGDPLKFGDAAAWRAPSATGADTRAVLGALAAVSKDEFDALAAAGVVYAPDGCSSQYAGRPLGQVPSVVGTGVRNVTVLELNGEEPSKAFAAQILADLGARVIRIDRPAGETVEPYPDESREASSRCGLNRNKQSVIADLKTSDGQRFFRTLAGHADVVLDNYRPGVLDRLGADWPTLSSLYPRLISCSITGFGHTGPWRAFPAFDGAIQALGGGMSITAAHTRPDVPVRWGNPIGGLTGSMYGALGILAALRLRNMTGRGHHLDLALLDAQVALLSYRAPQAVTLGRVFRPEPRRGGSGSLPFGVFATRDERWFVIGITPQFWDRFCSVAGHPEWTADPRFDGEPRRREHEAELNAMIEVAMLRHDAAEWQRRFAEAGIPGATVATVAEAFAYEQVAARSMLLTLPDQLHAEGVCVAGMPIKFSTAPAAPVRGAPLPGTDTLSIATEFGLPLPRG